MTAVETKDRLNGYLRVQVTPVAVIDALAAEPPLPAAVRPAAVAATPTALLESSSRGSLAAAEARCRAYLTTLPPAVEGQDGSGRTYQAARVIWNDFGIDEPDGFALLCEYNRKCQPPWEEAGRAGLRGKWDEAVKAGAGPQGRGYRVRRVRSADSSRRDDVALPALPDDSPLVGIGVAPREEVAFGLPWCDPARVAAEFLSQHTVGFVKKSGFVYRGGRYDLVGYETFDDLVWKFVERCRDREHACKLYEYDQRQEQRGEDSSGRNEQRPPEPPKISGGMVGNAVRAIRSRRRLPAETLPNTWIGGTRVEGGPFLVVANGLLDLTTRTLHAHTPAWFGLTALPVEYAAAAPPPPKFHAVIDELLEGNAEKKAVLQEVFGVTLDASLRAKEIVAFVGSGDNGKSVVLGVLRGLLGAGNYSAVDLHQLGTNRFASFPLFGKLANIGGDESSFDSADEGHLKALTGGDAVPFEEKGRTPFFGPNTAKLIFSTNAVPTFADQSEGVWNRLVIVRFGYVVPAAQKDPRLLDPEFWAVELPGVLNWALDGLDRVRRNRGVSRPACVTAAVTSHRRDSDPARRFLLEKYREAPPGQAACLPAAGVYEEYKSWLDRNGYDAKRDLLNSLRFGKKVRQVFPRVTGGAHRFGSADPCWSYKNLAVADPLPENANKVEVEGDAVVAQDLLVE